MGSTGLDPTVGSTVVDHDKDFYYVGRDRHEFLKCSICKSFTPFLIYLETNEQACKYRPIGTRLYCPLCSPRAEHFKTVFPGETIFQEQSILNDQKFLELLQGYEYLNPYFEHYAVLDRIIITENARLRSAYKEIARKVLPKMKKLQLLMDLFPEVHRLPNRKFDSMTERLQALATKAGRIDRTYMELSEAEATALRDVFDELIDRTPRHQRTSSGGGGGGPVQGLFRAPAPAPATAAVFLTPARGDNDSVSSFGSIDVIRGQPAGADSDNDSNASDANASQHNTRSTGTSSSDAAQYSSQGSQPVGLFPVPMSSQSQSQSQSLVPSSQSMDLSSQEVGAPAGGGAANASIDSGSSDAGSNASMVTERHVSSPPSVPVRRVASPLVPDDQEPGPSAPKRRRTRKSNERPMNPTVDEFMRNPKHDGRNPRLDGG